MRRIYNLVHLVLAIVVALVLTPLMAGAAPRAQIASRLRGMATWKST